MTFYITRFYMFDSIRASHHNLKSFMLSEGSVKGEFFLPLVMMIVYYFAGNYDTVIHRSRLREMTSTAVCAGIGALVFFFTALLNDVSPERATNYEVILLLAGLLFIFVYIPRFLITRHTGRKIHSGKWSANTLVIGTSSRARHIVDQLKGRYRPMGMKVTGFVNVEAPGSCPGEIDSLPVYDIGDLPGLVRKLEIKKLIIVPHPNEQPATIELINRLFPLDLPMFITPDDYELMTARPRISNVVAMPLIDISRTDMPLSTLKLKRLSDIIVSSIALMVLSPLMAAIAVAVKRDSAGPVFYRQERVGYHKKKFNILKFRTMKVDAEVNGPALSSENDPRITGVGRVLRRYRLDELPNFWNVLVGDMSIVGPRPEREHFIRRILERAPRYTLVHRVRPGITSWGMVQYGYANTIEGMVERLNYDLIYLENVSFLIDIKILIHTIKTVIGGRGM